MLSRVLVIVAKTVSTGVVFPMSSFDTSCIRTLLSFSTVGSSFDAWTFSMLLTGFNVEGSESRKGACGALRVTAALRSGSYICKGISCL